MLTNYETNRLVMWLLYSPRVDVETLVGTCDDKPIVEQAKQLASKLEDTVKSVRARTLAPLIEGKCGDVEMDYIQAYHGPDGPDEFGYSNDANVTLLRPIFDARLARIDYVAAALLLIGEYRSRLAI